MSLPCGSPTSACSRLASHSSPGGAPVTAAQRKSLEAVTVMTYILSIVPSRFP